MAKLRYSDFEDQIDLDAFYGAIGFEPFAHEKDNDIGHCLFPERHTHGDTTGKFGIHREKRVYNCWVCGGGSILSLAMEVRDLEYDDAVHWMRQFASGDKRDDKEFLDEFMSMFEDVERRSATLPYFNKRVLERYDDEITEAWDYDLDEPFLEGRGISEDIACVYDVHYQELAERRPPKGKFADDPNYVGPTLIFPHYWQDRLVGWQQRWLDPERPKWLGKYTNTGDFPKEDTIYNYDTAIKYSKSVIVVESPVTVLYLLSHGYNAVATFGDSVNPPQLRLLRRFTDGVILAPDNDSAGVKWLSANTNYLKRFIKVQHVDVVEGEKNDLANYRQDTDALHAHLANAYLPELDF